MTGAAAFVGTALAGLLLTAFGAGIALLVVAFLWLTGAISAPALLAFRLPVPAAPFRERAL